MKYVYHSSSIQGIKKFEPNVSTHNEKWVYAAKDKAISAVFLSGLGGDFTCCIGRDNLTGKVYICERFEGAFNYRYKGKSGSIYVLPGESFIEGKTHWEEEVVSTQAIEPIEEIIVEDVAEFLYQLEEEGELIIKLYPEKIDGIPQDDEDLVHRGIVWTRSQGEGVLDKMKLYHPNLLERVRKGLAEGRYQ